LSGAVDRGEQERALRDIVGTAIYDAAYARLRLSVGWRDPTFGLTDLEFLAIWIYTTPNDWHRQINEALWRGSPPAATVMFARILDDALRKLPSVTRTVYRGWRASSPDHFSRTHQVGSVHVWPGFTSTTRTAEKAYIGNVLFRIGSLTGRSLHGVGAEESEEEVLFMAGTRFMVSAVSLRGDGIALVDMVEIEMGETR
jgi:hypothetical protein